MVSNVLFKMVFQGYSSLKYRLDGLIYFLFLL